MAYMINVDLESKNVSGGASGCQSRLHESLGAHFDLTVHALSCQIRGGRAVDRLPTRYWDDNGGSGYSFSEVVQLARKLKERYPAAHPRRCQKCEVESTSVDSLKAAINRQAESAISSGSRDR